MLYIGIVSSVEMVIKLHEEGLLMSNKELKQLSQPVTKTSEQDIIKETKKVYADLLSAKGYDLGTINSELQRLKDELKNIEQIKPVYDSNIADCEELPSFLDTLEVKDVDLEKELGKYLDTNDIEFSYQIKLLDFAKYFLDLGLKLRKENNYGTD